MKPWRIVIASVVVTIVGAVIGATMCGGVFNWVYSIEPTNVWRPMEGPPGAMFQIGMLVLNVVFVLVYVLLKQGIPGKNAALKGLVFGLCVWAVGTLPGMLATHTFMTVATTVVIYWTIFGLVQILLQGLIVALIYGE